MNADERTACKGWIGEREYMRPCPNPEPCKLHPRATYEEGPRGPRRPTTSECTWTQENDDTLVYSTSCDGLFELNQGTPHDNGFVFCPYCGKPIVKPCRKSDA